MPGAGSGGHTGYLDRTRHLKKSCPLDAEGESILELAMQELSLMGVPDLDEPVRQISYGAK